MERSSQVVIRLLQPHISLFLYFLSSYPYPNPNGIPSSVSSNALNRWLSRLFQRTEIKFQREWPHIRRYPTYMELMNRQMDSDTPAVTCGLVWKNLNEALQDYLHGVSVSSLWEQFWPGLLDSL